jgi:hypothetical protein
MMFILKREARSEIREGEMKVSLSFVSRFERSSDPSSVMVIRNGRVAEDI